VAQQGLTVHTGEAIGNGWSKAAEWQQQQQQNSSTGQHNSAATAALSM
jgi:hypothetical protein